MNSNPNIAVGVPKHSSPSSRQSTRKKDKKDGDDSRGKRSTRREKDEEDSDITRTKRREKEDRDAKRKARPSKASVPGAHASTGEHKSNRKSSRRSPDNSKDHRHHRSSRSPKRDEKSAYRSSRSSASLLPGAQARSGPATVPGAQAETSSPKSRSKRDEKGKERRSTRASKPGAEASTSSRDRSKSKSGGRTNNENDINIAPNEGPPQFSEDGEAVVAATIVEEEEEENEDAKEEREQARIKQMVAAETERERQRMEAENQRLREEMERTEAERNEKKRKKKKRNILIVCVVLILLIAGGVGAFFALQGGSSLDPVIENQEEETLDPSTTPSEFPSNNPSSGPTKPPTIFRKYDLPSDEECERIASGLALDGEEDMDVKSFDILIDVDLTDESDIEPLVPELQTKLEQTLVPDLIGCPRDGFVERRHLEVNDPGLMWENIRYAIAKAEVSVSVAEGEACKDTESTTCTVLAATITVTVREEEKILNLIAILSTVFRAGVNIKPDLQLQAPFDIVIVRFIKSNDPTKAPTIAPTGTASENPTSGPTTSPSRSPTRAPIIGPVAPAPTKAPTTAPSRAPTTPPTTAPTPTPPPTFAPQPGLTPPPTPPPTARPTRNPSWTPSATPSNKPSLEPSAGPSIQDSIAPSPAPTNGPTSGPTSSPTSPAPTSTYIGCFQDQPVRSMDVLVGGEMDVEGCREFCRNTGFPYSAIQFGFQCFCGNSYDTYGTASDCDSPCRVNPADDQYCGGGFTNSVYFSGAPVTSVVPALDSNLYCGCTADDFGNRDLPHLSPYVDLSQVGCIHYCKSQGYAFAGLQWVKQCFCGDDAGSYGESLNCFTVDKDRDGNPDVCLDWSVGACYDGSLTDRCECGGADANTLFRTSQAVSCPSMVPPTQDYLGCKDDAVDRDVSVGGSAFISVADCRNLCKDIGFAYSAMQFGKECFCGNSYGNYGSSSSCTFDCEVDSSESRCGGIRANSVYWSGVTALATVSDLEENLYCGCMRDVPRQRDLEHQAPYIHLTQKSCILYCRAKGYDFAGLQNRAQCFCGNNPGTHSFSQSCDKTCRFQEASSCYDDSSSCTCGGANANDLFRTSASVSCPEVTEESYTYIGCYRDDNTRVMETYALRDQLVPECVAACREMGFPFAGLQAGSGCKCGNQYDSLGTADNCDRDCLDGSVECGGDWANSVYATGISSSVSVLEDDLYCGCTADDPNNRDLPHKSPYNDLSQTACIYYCKSKGYNFAALQWVEECYCGDSAGSLGASFGCDTVDKNNDGNPDQCYIADESAGCYSGTIGCSCGGGDANSLFRTSTSVSCPSGANLISKDYAVAEWDAGSTTNENYVPALAIDGNTCGDFFGCLSVAEIFGSPTNPYWQVILGFKTTVRRVIVWNRTDCCSDRMFGLELQLLNSMGAVIESRGITIGENNSNNPASQTFEFGSGVQNVVYVRIQRSGVATLNIAEVQVFS